MVKKIILSITLILLLAAGWLFFSPCTKFQEDKIYWFIKTGKNEKAAVIGQLIEEDHIKHVLAFEYIGNIINLWPKIQPGKYEIKKGCSLFSFIRMLRNHHQATINLVITKLRTPENLAGLVSRKFECDSAVFLKFLQNEAAINKFSLNKDRVLFIVHPNTYTLYWDAKPEDILEKIYDYHEDFWNDERKQKAKSLGLTPLEATTLASIVEEETLVDSEKPIITRVYLNRLNKNMPLGADPTIKFATGNFELRRILLKHIHATAQSPYNTYTNTGLPPGPICTPQDATIDAVLNPDDNEYLFFCAAPGFKGTHNFAVTDKEHLDNARAYQRWLNEEGIR
jgi:UPF0755 protein